MGQAESVLVASGLEVEADGRSTDEEPEPAEPLPPEGSDTGDDAAGELTVEVKVALLQECDRV